MSNLEFIIQAIFVFGFIFIPAIIYALKPDSNSNSNDYSTFDRDGRDIDGDE